MPAEWKKETSNSGTLQIQVNADDFAIAMDEAFKKVTSDMKIDGFRKGKVPKAFFKERYGMESLYPDAVDIVLPKAYSEAVEATGIYPVAAPELDYAGMEVSEEKGLSISAKIYVKPDVELGEYKGLEIEKVKVTPKEVEAEIQTVLAQKAEMVLKEDGAVENGDTAVIDFEGFVDEVPFEGGKGENYPLEIGSNSFIPGFEEQLIGVKEGETVDVNVTFPEEYHAEELKGKDSVFKVTVHEIKVKEVPELTDELVAELEQTEKDTVKAYKAEVKERLLEQKKSAQKDILLAKAADNATIDIPEAMYETEINRLLQNFEQQLSQSGMNLELYYQFTGTTEEGLREQIRVDAEKNVRGSLVLEAIVAQENFEVTDEDIEAEIKEMAKLYNMEYDQVKSFFDTQTEQLRSELKTKKALDFLSEAAVEVEAKKATKKKAAPKAKKEEA